MSEKGRETKREYEERERELLIESVCMIWTRISNEISSGCERKTLKGQENERKRDRERKRERENVLRGKNPFEGIPLFAYRSRSQTSE